MPHADPAVRAAYLREYKRKNRWRYRARDKAHDCARHANERAARYGCDGILTTDEAAALLEPNACHYCGGDETLGLDHVIPLSKGGVNRPENIVLACQACNASKWTGEQPGRWARDHDACVECGTSERPHFVHGWCARCYSRNRGRAERASGARCDGALVRDDQGAAVSCSRGARCSGFDKTHSVVRAFEPWHRAGMRHPKQRLNADMVASIRARYAAGGTTYAALASQYQVSQSAIGSVVRGVTGGPIEAPSRLPTSRAAGADGPMYTDETGE